MATTDAKPIPKKNVAHREYFRIWKSDGSLLEETWTSVTSVRSLDGASESATTSTATQIGTTSRGYIDLSSAEMNTDNTGVKITVSNTDAIPVIIELSPQDVGDIVVNAEQLGGQTASASGTVLLDNLGVLSSVLAETNNNNILDQFKLLSSVTESARGHHAYSSAIGNVFFVDPANGNTHASGNRGGISDPYSLVQDCHDNAITDSNHDMIILLAGNTGGITTLTESVTITKRYLMIRGPGQDFRWTRSGSGDTITVSASGVELSGFELMTAAVGSGAGIVVTTNANSVSIHNLNIFETQGNSITMDDSDDFIISDCILQGSGQNGSGHGIEINSGPAETSNYGKIENVSILDTQGDGIRIDTTGGGNVHSCRIKHCVIEGATDDGIHIVDSNCTNSIIADCRFGNNTNNNLNDSGTNTVFINNEQWAIASDISGGVDVISLGGNTTALQNLETVYDGNEGFYSAYAGPYGPGVYLNPSTSNTNTVTGIDGTPLGAVSTFAAAKTICTALGIRRIYIDTTSTFTTIDTTLDSYEIIGIKSPIPIQLSLNSQNVANTLFRNLTIYDTQGGTSSQKMYCIDCNLYPLNIKGMFFGCILYGSTITTGGDCVFNNCSEGDGVLPQLTFAATNTIIMNNWSGQIKFNSMVTANTLILNGNAGKTTFDAGCTGGTANIRGNFSITDDSGGAVTITENATWNRTAFPKDGSGFTALPPVDVDRINGSYLAAIRLALSAGQIVIGTVEEATTTPTSTVFAASNITEATADHYNGRIIIFTTGALTGQATDITDYELDTGEGKFTVSTLTEPPSDADTFIIV